MSASEVFHERYCATQATCCCLRRSTGRTTLHEAIFFSVVGVPRRTPAEIVEKLNREINAVLVDHNIKARIADLGGVAFPTSPAEFSKFMADETETWAKVIRAANIKAE